MVGSPENPLACTPPAPTLTRVTTGWAGSVTLARKMSLTPLVSPPTRLLASERKATQCPSPLMIGSKLRPLPEAPAEVALTRKVVFVCVSRRKTSLALLASPAARLLASLLKATNRPSELTELLPELPLAGAPPRPTLTRVTDKSRRSSSGSTIGAAARAAERIATARTAAVRGRSNDCRESLGIGDYLSRRGLGIRPVVRVACSVRPQHAGGFPVSRYRPRRGRKWRDRHLVTTVGLSRIYHTEAPITNAAPPAWGRSVSQVSLKLLCDRGIGFRLRS